MELKTKFEWQEYLEILLRRKWFFIIPLVCIFILSIVVSFVIPKTYEAKAIILVEEENIVNPLLSNLAVSTPVVDRLHRLREEILSWPRLLQLVEELKLNKKARNPLELEELILDIRRHISLQMKGRDIIIISYQGRDPNTTQDLVNTLCDILIRKNLLAQSSEADSAIIFIEEQLKTYKEKLETAEEALRKFKETYGLQMPLATQINEELARLEADLTSALVDCTEEHPRVIELRRRIASLKEKRLQQIKEAAKYIDVKDSQDYINIADSIPKQQEELARLTRDRQVNEEIYAMLLQRLETARITKQLESSENKTKFKIVEPARLPLRPASPNKLKVNFLGLVFAGVIGFGCTYLVESTDHSFKNPDDFKNRLNLPVLGSISKIVSEEDIQKRKNFIKNLLIVAGSTILLLIIITVVVIKASF